MTRRPGVRRRAAGGAAVLAGALAALGACGGGGGGGSSAGNDDSGGTSGGWTPGVFLDADTYAAHCVAPRSGIDPYSGAPYLDLPGSRTDENNWLRSWTHDLYLWYDEVTDRNPADYATLEYFDLLKTFATTPSGTAKDKFHFTYPTDEWIALSQSGVSAGYGAEWIILAEVPPRQLVVAFTQPGSPATAPAASLARGAEVLTVDGVDLVYANDQASVDVLNAGLWPSSAGEVHTFTVMDPGAGVERVVTMQSANVTSHPVQNVTAVQTATGRVGYLLFNEHIATAEQALHDAVVDLRAEDIDDLVLDLRYNGGGYLDIASELAYMIAGPVPTAGRTFEELRFNDKHPVTNPVTGAPLAPVPFHTTAQGFSGLTGALPSLDLSRVFVLTGPNTCSASESIMNGLRGVGVEVIQLGSTTCGKPYGFYAWDNCGTTYFSIQFKGVNEVGFGDYTDGFAPSHGAATSDTIVPGCAVLDDFTHALGDPEEIRFAAALAYRDGQGCPFPPARASAAAKSAPQRTLAAADGRLRRSPWLENRILRRPQ
jgi:hypothetical protein